MIREDAEPYRPSKFSLHNLKRHLNKHAGKYVGTVAGALVGHAAGIPEGGALVGHLAGRAFDKERSNMRARDNLKIPAPRRRLAEDEKFSQPKLAKKERPKNPANHPWTKDWNQWKTQKYKNAKWRRSDNYDSNKHEINEGVVKNLVKKYKARKEKKQAIKATKSLNNLWRNSKFNKQ